MMSEIPFKLLCLISFYHYFKNPIDIPHNTSDSVKVHAKNISKLALPTFNQTPKRKKNKNKNNCDHYQIGFSHDLGMGNLCRKDYGRIIIIQS